MSRTLYTDQTRKLPRTSSHGNKYQMILPKIYSNSTWIEPMKNRTEGEIIISRERALMRIRLCGLKPKHQILDNEASEKYKEEIRASRMTYQIAPPDDHQHNIAKKGIQFWSDHFISVISGAAATSPSTCGTRSSRKQKNNCYYYDNQISTKTYHCMPTYTATMTILPSLSCPSEWRHSFTRIPEKETPGMRTPPKGG